MVTQMKSPEDIQSRISWHSRDLERLESILTSPKVRLTDHTKNILNSARALHQAVINELSWIISTNE